ncbi:hypothetical protein HDU97_004612 [Phlyctochytrium planicorne]|nr:hypothetical protein HDU97_004612 [Phlyctochytrium planicorne]
MDSTLSLAETTATTSAIATSQSNIASLPSLADASIAASSTLTVSDGGGERGLGSLVSVAGVTDSMASVAGVTDSMVSIAGVTDSMVSVAGVTDSMVSIADGKIGESLTGLDGTFDDGGKKKAMGSLGSVAGSRNGVMDSMVSVAEASASDAMDSITSLDKAPGMDETDTQIHPTRSIPTAKRPRSLRSNSDNNSIRTIQSHRSSASRSILSTSSAASASTGNASADSRGSGGRLGTGRKWSGSSGVSDGSSGGSVRLKDIARKMSRDSGSVGGFSVRSGVSGRSVERDDGGGGRGGPMGLMRERRRSSGSSMLSVGSGSKSGRSVGSGGGGSRSGKESMMSGKESWRSARSEVEDDGSVGKGPRSRESSISTVRGRTGGDGSVIRHRSVSKAERDPSVHKDRSVSRTGRARSSHGERSVSRAGRATSRHGDGRDSSINRERSVSRKGRDGSINRERSVSRKGRDRTTSRERSMSKKGRDATVASRPKSRSQSRARSSSRHPSPDKRPRQRSQQLTSSSVQSHSTPTSRSSCRKSESACEKDDVTSHRTSSSRSRSPVSYSDSSSHSHRRGASDASEVSLGGSRISTKSKTTSESSSWSRSSSRSSSGTVRAGRDGRMRSKSRERSRERDSVWSGNSHHSSSRGRYDVERKHEREREISGDGDNSRESHSHDASDERGSWWEDEDYDEIVESSQERETERERQHSGSQSQSQTDSREEREGSEYDESNESNRRTHRTRTNDSIHTDNDSNGSETTRSRDRSSRHSIASLARSHRSGRSKPLAKSAGAAVSIAELSHISERTEEDLSRFGSGSLEGMATMATEDTMPMRRWDMVGVEEVGGWEGKGIGGEELGSQFSQQSDESHGERRRDLERVDKNDERKRRRDVWPPQRPPSSHLNNHPSHRDNIKEGTESITSNAPSSLPPRPPRDLTNPHVCATIIQSLFRSHLARVNLAREHAAATVIQRHVRGHILRRRIRQHLKIAKDLSTREERLYKFRGRVKDREKELRDLKGTHPSRVEDKERARVLNAVVMLQSFVRGWRARRKVREMKRRRRKMERRGRRNGELVDEEYDEEEEECERSRYTSRSPSPGGRDMALLTEASATEAKQSILNRLRTQRLARNIELPVLLSRSRHPSAGRSRQPSHHRHSSAREGIQDMVADHTATMAGLMANLAEAGRLFETLQDDEVGGKGHYRWESGKTEWREKSVDLSKGCRALRRRCDAYLTTILGKYQPTLSMVPTFELTQANATIGCLESLDCDADSTIPPSLIPPHLRASSRASHISSLRDGKKPWWDTIVSLDDEKTLKMISSDERRQPFIRPHIVANRTLFDGPGIEPWSEAEIEDFIDMAGLEVDGERVY